MAGESTQIAFTIGARRLFTTDRVLDPFAFSLEEALAGIAPTQPPDLSLIHI